MDWVENLIKQNKENEFSGAQEIHWHKGEVKSIKQKVTLYNPYTLNKKNSENKKNT